MLKFTLDTNCIIAVAERRPESNAIRRLAEAQRAGAADVALVAISASERQEDGSSLESFATFQERIASLKLGHLDLLFPMFYWDVVFWDACLWVEPDMVALESKIQNILFPNIPVSWPDYCSKRGIDTSIPNRDTKWKNAKCDVQAFWCHAYRNRNVFVTSDKNYHAASKKPHLVALSSGRVEFPSAAAMLL